MKDGNGSSSGSLAGNSTSWDDAIPNSYHHLDEGRERTNCRRVEEAASRRWSRGPVIVTLASRCVCVLLSNPSSVGWSCIDFQARALDRLLPRENEDPLGMETSCLLPLTTNHFLATLPSYPNLCRSTSTSTRIVYKGARALFHILLRYAHSARRDAINHGKR